MATITIGKGTAGERTITSTGEKDPRGFETFRGPGGEILTQQQGRFIIGRPAQPAVAAPVSTDPIAGIFSDPASTPKQKFAANLFTLLNRKQEAQAEFRTDVRERQAGLRTQAADIVSEPTPEDLRRFDPAVAETERAGKVSALGPESRFVERQAAFADELFIAATQALEQARLLSEDIFPDVPDPAAVANLVKLVESGQMKIGEVPAEFASAVLAGVNPDNIQISERDKLELEQMRVDIVRTKQLSIGGGGGISGGVLDLSSIPAVEVPTFDEFIAEKEQVLLQSLSPKGREQFRKEYDQLVSSLKRNDVTTMNNEFQRKLIATRPAKFASENATEQFNSLINAGDFKGAQEITDALGIPINQTTARELAELQSSVLVLADLNDTIRAYEDKFGPIQGSIATVNKFDPLGQAINAQIASARQSVGKAKEGGVLRKEDEIKYKKILTVLNDLPEVGIFKAEVNTRDVANQYNSLLDSLNSANFNISGFRNLETGISPAVALQSLGQDRTPGSIISRGGADFRVNADGSFTRIR